MTKIFCDGACSGNPGKGGWAIQIQYDDGSIEELGGKADPATNNTMEMEAVWQALSRVHSLPGPVTIYTDSKYVVNGLNGWIAKWKANSWRRKADNNPVANLEIWQKLDQLMEARFQIKWVKGHDGHEAQERVDQLASDLSKGRPVQFFFGTPEKKKPDQRYPSYLAAWGGVLYRFMNWPECENFIYSKKGVNFKKVKSGIEEEQLLVKWGVNKPGGE
jgi:ribonuclease HI